MQMRTDWPPHVEWEKLNTLGSFSYMRSYQLHLSLYSLPRLRRKCNTQSSELRLQNVQAQLWRKCIPQRDCVPALTLLKMCNLQPQIGKICTPERRDWDGDRMSLETTKSKVEQGGVRGRPLDSGASDTEWHPTKHSLTAALQTRRDPESSMDSTAPRSAPRGSSSGVRSVGPCGENGNCIRAAEDGAGHNSTFNISSRNVSLNNRNVNSYTGLVMKPKAWNFKWHLYLTLEHISKYLHQNTVSRRLSW